MVSFGSSFDIPAHTFETFYTAHSICLTFLLLLFDIFVDIFGLLTLVNTLRKSVNHSLKNVFIIINGKALILVNTI